MKERIMQTKELCKSFAHNGGQIHILQHIDLELYRGDFYRYHGGASGSGKSTLLYALSGMDRATAGSVVYYDHKSMENGAKTGTDLVKLSEKKLAELRHTDFGFIFSADASCQ